MFLYRLCAAFVLVLFVLAAAPAARAQQGALDGAEKTNPVGAKTDTPTLMMQQYPVSHPERFLLAFYKVAGLQPDFLSWARKSPFLAGAKKMDVDSIVSRETNRLSQSFAAFDVNEPLVVHTKVLFDEYSTIQEKLHLSEFTPRTYFAYSLYGVDVAVVPKGIAELSDLKIERTRMDEIVAKSAGSQIEAELLLRPVAADARAPFVSNGRSYWLLLADIAEIRFWSGATEPRLLWMKRADWYKPREDKALLDLKKGGNL